MTAIEHAVIVYLLALLRNGVLFTLKNIRLQLPGYDERLPLFQYGDDPHKSLTTDKMLVRFPRLESVHISLGHKDVKDVHITDGTSSRAWPSLRASQFIRVVEDMKLLTVAAPAIMQASSVADRGRSM
jgi:hypothetical protein